MKTSTAGIVVLARTARHSGPRPRRESGAGADDIQHSDAADGLTAGPGELRPSHSVNSLNRPTTSSAHCIHIAGKSGFDGVRGCFFFLIVCFTSYLVFSIAGLPHSPGVVYYC